MPGMDGIDFKVEMDSVARYGWINLPGPEQLGSIPLPFPFAISTMGLQNSVHVKLF